MSEKNQDAKIAQLEARIARLEALLKVQPPPVMTGSEPVPDTPPSGTKKAENLEFQIGQFWLAKTGIIILTIGFAFLLTFPYQAISPSLPSLIGLILAVMLYGLSHLWRKSYVLISGYLLGCAFLLLYFSALRLYFFGEEPLIGTPAAETMILTVVVAFTLYIAISKKSVFLSAISLTLGFITGLINGQAYFIFILNCFLSLAAVLLYIRLNWHSLLSYTIFLTYLCHIIWFLNNPVMGNRMAFVASPESNILFILVYVIIFAAGTLFRNGAIPENNQVIATGFFNAAGGFSLLLLVTLAKFQSVIFIYHLAGSVVFLSLSIWFWIKEESKVSTFFYAIAGYSTLSIALIAHFENPDYFIMLSWQSILVISTAIWFRSKFIIVANFIIFLVIFMVYLILSRNVDAGGLSFGIIALISARVMNWQKNRLDLKTEAMRNAYLAGALIMFPYALYHIVPERYISLSWIGIALIYYLLGHVLKNVKYRWMALITLLGTVIYILFIGTIRLEPGLRILTFILLGLVLLTTSFIYTRLRSKSSEKIEGKK